MGMDMHCTFQKEAAPGRWHHVPNNFSDTRSYELYAWLGAPKRGSEARNNRNIAICEMRGLPKGVNYEDYDDFGYTWLTADEILTAPLPDEPGDVLLEFVAEVKRLHAEHGNLRVILGFEG